MAAALEGIRVLELASYVSGPFAGMMMGDLGAEVIKIEKPEQGDPFRQWGQDLYGATFLGMNRNKKSLTLNLADPRGRDLFLQLAETADVVIENFRPQVAERLGIGYDTLRERNPGLVYCSITAFGEEGPYSQRPGYDTIGQAMSGLLGMLTDFQQPAPVGVSLSDHITGLYAAYAILSALLWRVHSGKGQRVETSLLQSSIAFLGENWGTFFASGRVPARGTRVRLAQVYAFVDQEGLPFVLHLSSPPKFFAGLAAAIGLPELVEDERFCSHVERVQHYDELNTLLGNVFQRGARSDWLARLQERDVPCAPLYAFNEVFSDPHIGEMGLIWQLQHPVKGQVQVVGSGIQMRETPVAGRLAPPLLGEHNRDILAQLGLSSGTIADMQQAGVL